MGNLIAEIDLDGRELTEVVQEWLDANQDSWQPWAACAG
jgi:ABC-type proline/glycine betaine transport system substrate-binding protein